MIKPFINCFIFLLLAAQLSGCATVSTGYTPSEKIHLTETISHDELNDITFSLNFTKDVSNFDTFDKEDIVKKIKSRLRKSGIYKGIFYAPLDKRSSNHLHFNINIKGLTPTEDAGIGALAGSTLMLIPVAFNTYIDMSAFVIKDDTEVFSSTAPEKIKTIIWLPLVVLSPFFNNYTTGHYILNKQLDYLIADIYNNKDNLRISSKE